MTAQIRTKPFKTTPQGGNRPLEIVAEMEPYGCLSIICCRLPCDSTSSGLNFFKNRVFLATSNLDAILLLRGLLVTFYFEQ